MLLAKNRKALYNYEVIDKYMAGIVLRGFEVKAIREGKVNFEGAFVKVRNGQAFVTGMHIGRYSKLSQDISDEFLRRDRKLLLNKHEIVTLSAELNQKGKSAVPLALLLQRNMIKLELAVVRGKKKGQKKAIEKEKQIKKDLEQQFKSMKKSQF